MWNEIYKDFFIFPEAPIYISLKRMLERMSPELIGHLKGDTISIWKEQAHMCEGSCDDYCGTK